MHGFLKVFLAAVLFAVPVSQAQARVFVWQDEDTKFEATFPDSWKRIHNQQPDDVLTIAAPTTADGVDNYATCRLRVREDKRFTVYPRNLAPAVQRTEFSRDFWFHYVGEYENAVVNTVTDNAGLGQGFASYADASYATVAGPKLSKRAVMYATNYNTHNYIFECAAEAGAYDAYYNDFMRILSTVDMRKEFHNYRRGHYRDFPNDPPVLINNIDTIYRY